MKDSIYTIPVNEVFEEKCGCPICKMRNTLETRCVDYIMGAAMMEPDVRIETNKQGFCKPHFDMMLNKKNRLSLALILESHLIELQKDIKNRKSLSKKAKKGEGETCFVCAQIDWAIKRMFSTIIKLYNKEEEFRELFDSQEFLCFKHYKELCAFAEENMPKKLSGDFLASCEALCSKGLSKTQNDISHYCKMFDYRNSGKDADWGDSKDSIERAIHFLTSRECL